MREGRGKRKECEKREELKINVTEEEEKEGKEG